MPSRALLSAKTSTSSRRIRKSTFLDGKRPESAGVKMKVFGLMSIIGRRKARLIRLSDECGQGGEDAPRAAERGPRRLHKPLSAENHRGTGRGKVAPRGDQPSEIRHRQGSPERPLRLRVRSKRPASSSASCRGRTTSAGPSPFTGPWRACRSGSCRRNSATTR